MSGSSAKVTRRQIRRAMGENGIGVVAEVQSHMETLGNSLALAHRRLDALQESLDRLRAEKESWKTT